MPRKTRLEIAKQDIVKRFSQSETTIFRQKDISEIVNENSSFWRLAGSMRLSQFTEFMVKKTKMKRLVFEFPHRKETLYTWGDISIFKIIQSLKPDSYFTHYTAVYLNELTEQIPKTIYLNHEQQQKRFIPQKLEQSNIDYAFKNKVRVSNNTATYEDFKITILNGKYTGKSGVMEMGDPSGEKIYVTTPERTLIDITIRPVYAGGIFEVLKAYELAAKKVSVNKLTALLKKIKFIYPYHQAIGFYLERSNAYKESQIRLLEKFPINNDFYLVHNMKTMAYSKKWHLHYPKEF